MGLLTATRCYPAAWLDVGAQPKLHLILRRLVPFFDLWLIVDHCHSELPGAPSAPWNDVGRLPENRPSMAHPAIGTRFTVRDSGFGTQSSSRSLSIRLMVRRSPFIVHGRTIWGLEFGVRHIASLSRGAHHRPDAKFKPVPNFCVLRVSVVNPRSGYRPF